MQGRGADHVLGIHVSKGFEEIRAREHVVGQRVALSHGFCFRRGLDGRVDQADKLTVGFTEFDLSKSALNFLPLCP